MPLKELSCDFNPARDTELLRSFTSLEHINHKPVAEFWKEVEAKQKGKKLGFQMPGFDQWIKEVRALPAEQQVEAVAKKLQELNPGFDGQMRGSDGFNIDHETPTIENGVVTQLELKSDDVTDLSPLRAFKGLRSLKCTRSNTRVSGRAKLTDLSPLSTLMSLRNLNVAGSQVSDLKPLSGMSLEGLVLYNAPVTDLGPLEGITSLNRLLLGWNPITDLSPLKGTSLTTLDCRNTGVSDLSPLAKMPLTGLHVPETLVTDLSPLEGMNVVQFTFTPKNITKGIEAIRQMQSLKSIGAAGPDKEKFPPAEFWKKYDAGEFGKPATSKPITDLTSPAFQQWMKDVAAMPAEKQVDAVAKKMQELNPEFDGKLTGVDGTGTPNIEGGGVVHLGLVSDNVTDISPLRALVRLKWLHCSGSEANRSKLSDLSPLRGMALEALKFSLVTSNCGRIGARVGFQVDDTTRFQSLHRCESHTPFW